MSAMELLPEAIEGRIVDLRPLTSDYLVPLATAAKHAEIWTYLDEVTPDQDGVAALIDEAVEEQRQGLRLPYVIVERRTSEIIGSISFIDLQAKHRGVEIGWAWVTPSHWRTGAAREAAYLLMRYAFDHGAIRVVFKTDSRNTRSQRAIEGLGATREGVFRNHRILRDGYVRDSVFYSVTEQDWPAVQLQLEEWLLSLHS